MSTAHWAQSTDLGLETLTRFTDPANNSNKFRRFIAIQNPSDRREKMLLTQTGRWTSATARGNWNGGTYKFQKSATFGWEVSCTLEEFLNKNVHKKLGSYSISHQQQKMSYAGIQQAVRNCKGSAPWLSAPGTTVPTLKPAGPPVPAFGNLQEPRPASKPLGDQVAWLIRAASSGDFTKFELLSHYGQINSVLEAQRAGLDDAATQLQTALSLVMLKEA